MAQGNSVFGLLIIEDQTSKRLICLENSVYTIGRSLDNTLVVNHKSVSRTHAVLCRTRLSTGNGYGLKIIDGDLHGHRSTNGILVNGQRCLQHDLKHGDRISLGSAIKATYLSLGGVHAENTVARSSVSLDSVDHQETQTITIQTTEACWPLPVRYDCTDIPIIDIYPSGQIAGCNLAARQQFPDLEEIRLHPLVAGLAGIFQDSSTQKVNREVNVGGRVFEQLACAIAPSGLIRTFNVDITALRLQAKGEGSRPTQPQLHLDAFPDLVLLLNSQGLILDCKHSNDPALLALFAQAEAHQHISEVLPGTVSRQVIHYLKQAFHSGSNQTFDCEIPFRQQLIYCEIRMVLAAENRMMAIVRNISSRKSTEQQLRHDALHDSLTGLPNRTLFQQRVSYALKLAQHRPTYLFAVLFIDLDHFKVINDSLGHSVGDQLLMAIARKLEAGLRPTDMVARLGGDEFAILLENLNAVEEATHIAERLQHDLALPLQLAKHELFTNASIGIAFNQSHYLCPDDILRDADTAMYHAKSTGRSRYAVFDQVMHARAVTLMQLDRDLRHAVENQQFQIHYQPIVALDTGAIAGFEALLRWIHPERGLIPADEFIQLAEETGLIFAIGEWLLDEACRQLHQWKHRFPDHPGLTMNINLSSKQFTHPKLFQNIERTLRLTNLQPSELKLEITESIVMEDTGRSQALLTQLKNLGVQLCIDDFGTGYSSLSHLHRFPIDTLKIDRSFISGLDAEEENSGLVVSHMIAGLARHLGMNLVAEGIETDLQLSLVRKLGCDYGQGYVFSRPLSASQADDVLANQPHW